MNLMFSISIQREKVFAVSILLKERVRRFSDEVKRTELNCVI